MVLAGSVINKCEHASKVEVEVRVLAGSVIKK
jgi:hypothetical protein